MDSVRCLAVYGGPSAAKGGQCLLVSGHAGDHETHGIMSAVFSDTSFRITNDGSLNFKWDDDGASRV